MTFTGQGPHWPDIQLFHAKPQLKTSNKKFMRLSNELHDFAATAEQLHVMRKFNELAFNCGFLG